MNCDPLFTTVDLFPFEINKNTGDLKIMPDGEFKIYVERLRQHFIKIHKEKHPVFATSRTIDEIIEDLKGFNRIISNQTGENSLDDMTKKIAKNGPIKKLFNLENEKEPDIDTSLLLSYNTRYSNAVNHWFPEIWDTKISSGKAVTDQFYDEEQFFKNVRDIIIKDRFKLFNKHKSGGQTISDYLIQCMRIVSGNQPVYNFPSTLAKWLYLDKAKRIPDDQKEFNILDTSCGWGGRMLAAISSASDILLCNKQVNYWGTDPNTDVHDRFEKFECFWKTKISTGDDNFSMYKATLPAEDIFKDEKFEEKKGTFDIMFTSPPYFNKEMYSNDKDQSYITYKNDYELWREGFLHKMLKNTYDLLRPGGECIINIADVKYKGKNYHPLEADTVKYALECGFKHVKTYKMLFSIMPGNDKRSKEKKAFDKSNNVEIKSVKNKNTNGENPEVKNAIEYDGKKYKYEPMFVFVKE